jgi:CRISPR/Cas system-associated exonuclease Cas4 (RecB family)
MGITIQGVLEDLYNNELWKNPKGLKDRLIEMTEKRFKLELAGSYIDWNRAPSKEALLRTCVDGVCGYLKTMKQNRLLGPYARSEVDLVGYVNKYTPIGGRVDFLVRRDDTGTSILDGKNSTHKGKYTDPDQLRWYALCFYLSYHKMPDRIGFVYFRYPHGLPIEGSEEVESGVDWVDFSREDLRGIAERAVDARKNMDKEKFEPTPSPSACRFCDYETVCEARQQQKASRSRKRKKNPDIPDNPEGFFEL